MTISLTDPNTRMRPPPAEGRAALGVIQLETQSQGDTTGKELWSYSALMGVNGAHWDLDGDGTDELIVGMNGLGGLDAVSADGKKLSHVALANVWSQAVESSL